MIALMPTGKVDVRPASGVCDSHLDIDAFLKKNKLPCEPPSEQNISKLTVSDYKNENVMNGGALFADLHGYDEMEASWSVVGGEAQSVLQTQSTKCAPISL